MYGVELEAIAIVVPAISKPTIQLVVPAGSVAGFAYLVPKAADQG